MRIEKLKQKMIIAITRKKGTTELVLGDRKSVVQGKRVDLGGRRIIKKKKKNTTPTP